MSCFGVRCVAEPSISGRIAPSILLKSPQTSFFRSTLSRSIQAQLSGCGRVLSAPRLPVLHETVRDWEERFLPRFTEQIRTKRKSKVSQVWLVDKTYIRIKGMWRYLYRGINEDDNLVDVRLNKTRDIAGTKAFFAQAIGFHEDTPEKVATDGLASCPRAIAEELGQAGAHLAFGGNDRESQRLLSKQRVKSLIDPSNS